MQVRLSWLAALVVGAAPLVAQGEPLVEAIAAMDRHELARARTLFEAALQRDPESYQANWRLAHVLVDQGKAVPDSVASAPRDSLYRMAVSYARRAVTANPDGADGHFMLAAALGRSSLTQGKRERVRAAIEIRSEALRALAIDPAHAGAYHVLGRWHAEIKRLSSVERFFARNFLGGAILGQATWDEAERNLRLAVQHGPHRIFHRLDLARILMDREKYREAREQLEAILQMPRSEPMDAQYQEDAAMMLRRLPTGQPS